MLKLTRAQILAFRRRANALDARLPKSATSLRRAAWAGLQDSMPRAAVLSLHARIAGIQPSILDDRSLVQVWGPRYNVYVVAKRDYPLFTVGRIPDARAEQWAERLHSVLDGRRITDREVGLGNGVRYAAPTGRVLIRWEGARAPLVWMVERPSIAPEDACRELARRYLHVYGPAGGNDFAKWAGISRREAAAALASLEPELVRVRTPLGEEWLLAADEEAVRAAHEDPPARLLPSGDAYWLLDGAQRELLVPDPKRRVQLWTPRVWPGALLVDGEIRGTWRRAQHQLQIETWSKLTSAQRDAVEAEAAALPLPALEREIAVRWV